MKTLAFLDDGDGIPIEMHERVFEPRVTSKLETMVMDKWVYMGAAWRCTRSRRTRWRPA